MRVPTCEPRLAWFDPPTSTKGGNAWASLIGLPRCAVEGEEEIVGLKPISGHMSKIELDSVTITLDI